MRIVVTGAKGQLGKALQGIIAQYYGEWEVVALDRSRLDITNSEQVAEILNKYKPHVVINCAAYTDVEGCEDNEAYAYLANAEGPGYLAEQCNKLDITLVHISTDYVFSGEGNEPLKEEAILEPQTIYGQSKCLGESYIKERCKKYFVVRTAWLYGDGKNFVETMLRLADIKESISVVQDQIGSPTYTVDLAKAIIELIQTTDYGVYHIVNEGMCSWFQFAVKIFEYAHKEVKVIPIESAEYPCKAKRPKYSVLDCTKLKEKGIEPLRDWSLALQDYIQKRNK